MSSVGPGASPFGRVVPSLGALHNRTPTLAAVNGYCIGGGMTLMLATDLRVASTHATFRLPEVPLGMIPGNGGIRRAIADLSHPVVMEFVLLGHRMDGERAHELDLVNAVVAPDGVLPTALEWAHHIATLPVTAVRAAPKLAARAPWLASGDSARLESAFLRSLRQQSAVTAVSEVRGVQKARRDA